MLRTTSARNLFYLQKIKSRNLLADWLFVIYYDLSIFQLPLCWLKCCKAIYLSLLIVWGSCSVGKVSWYISYLTVIEFPLKRRNKNRRFPPNQHHNLTFSGFKTKSSGGNNLQSSQKFIILNIAAFLLPPHPPFPFSVYSNCDDLPFALMIPEGSSERSDITLTCIPPNWVISPSSWWRNPQITCQSLRKLIFYSSLRMSEHEH